MISQDTNTNTNTNTQDTAQAKAIREMRDALIIDIENANIKRAIANPLPTWGN